MIEELVIKHEKVNLHIKDLNENNSNCFTRSKTCRIKLKQKLLYSTSDEKKMMNSKHQWRIHSRYSNDNIEVSTFTFGIVLVGWPRLDWTESFAFGLSPLGAVEQRFDGTEGALPVDHTLNIKSVRAYKIIINFSLKYSETAYLLRGSQAHFFYPFNSFQSREYNLKWKHI